MISSIQQKLIKYCTYQERCHKEVLNKLHSLKIFGTEADLIIVFLIRNNFLNEARFAEQFAGGKLRIKKWGINKIKSGLIKKGIDEKLIARTLDKISKEDFDINAEKLIEKKWELLLKNAKGKSSRELKIKLQQFLLSKGYTWESIHSKIDKIH